MNLGYPRPLARLSGVAELSLGLAIPRLVAGAAIAAALSACAGRSRPDITVGPRRAPRRDECGRRRDRANRAPPQDPQA